MSRTCCVAIYFRLWHVARSHRDKTRVDSGVAFYVIPFFLTSLPHTCTERLPQTRTSGTEQAAGTHMREAAPAARQGSSSTTGHIHNTSAAMQRRHLHGRERQHLVLVGACYMDTILR
ncbi:hypothetical protein B0T11DRAFT_85421 [Plectosphaerella cucumerina]|uniref:Uncharacterized protein n=1 Tax=Plectosphaerella cucumerina TaxID=40658 RepID=A0A8K0TDD8_9PEZI|nr:hypothetical protein B0T11DRAFT_85421 [Plectosphaerella cucumerina]